jgi:hypothetical protein
MPRVTENVYHTLAYDPVRVEADVSCALELPGLCVVLKDS